VKYFLFFLFLGAEFTFGELPFNPKTVLKEAKEHTKKGDYEEALKKHLWYHHNILKHQPSQYGVRLSFALGYWIELAGKYPPALKSLKEVRDGLKLKLGNDKEAFHDYLSINQYLKDYQETLETYEKFGSSHKWVKRFYDEFFEQLIHINDAAVMFPEMAEETNVLLLTNHCFRTLQNAIAYPPKGDSTFLNWAKKSFKDQINQLTEIYTKNGYSHTNSLIKTIAKNLLLSVGMNENLKWMVPEEYPIGVVSPDWLEELDFPARVKKITYFSNHEVPPAQRGHSHCEGIYIYDVDSHQNIRFDKLGVNSSPVFSKDGKILAYLKHDWEDMKNDSFVQLYNMDENKISAIKFPNLKRFNLNWHPDSKHLFCPTNEGVVKLNIYTGANSIIHEVKGGPEGLSSSPDGKYLTYWKREGVNDNDSDGWILYLFNLENQSLKKFGKKNDGHGAVGRTTWTPDSKSFSCSTFLVDQNNERSERKELIFDLTFKVMGERKKGDMIVHMSSLPWCHERMY
jgi:tetratricopeptide (TPR) repeat protein